MFNVLTDVCILQFTRTFAISQERLQYYIGGVGPNDYDITEGGGTAKRLKYYREGGGVYRDPQK